MHAFTHTCVHTYVIQAKHNANSELLLDKRRLHRGIFISVTSNDRSHGRMLTHTHTHVRIQTQTYMHTC